MKFNKKIFNKNFFYILGLISIVLVSVSSVLLISNYLDSVEILGSVSTNGDCIPYNVFVKKGEKNFSIDITWSTSAECVGFVQYGKERDNLSMVVVDLVNTSKSKEHRVSIEQLLTTEKYYYLINSGEQAYGNSGIPLDFVLADL